MKDWWIEGATLRGQSHEKNGLPNQDSACFRRNDESSALVVCDGAGTASHSHFGSTVAARAVAELLVENASDVMNRRLDGRTVVDVAVDAIHQVAVRQGKPLKEYACTLVALLVHDGHLMTCHIGDGAIYLLDREHPVCVSPPANGRDGGTYFVTRQKVTPRMWTMKLPDNVTGFLVTSDGASKLHSPVTQWVMPMVTRLINALDFGSASGWWLEQLCRYELAPHTGDDITVLAARRPYVAGVYGCPQCGSLGVSSRVNARGTALVGKCRNCTKTVFYYDDVKEAASQLKQRLVEAGARVGKDTRRGRPVRESARLRGKNVESTGGLRKYLIEAVLGRQR